MKEQNVEAFEFRYEKLHIELPLRSLAASAGVIILLKNSLFNLLLGLFLKELPI